MDEIELRPKNNNALAILQGQSNALALTDKPDVMQRIRSSAYAAAQFAAREHNHELAQRAKRLELEAAYKLGLWLRDNVSHSGGYSKREGFVPLPELINATESSRLQLLAKVPKEKFIAWIDEHIAQDREFSYYGAQKYATNYVKGTDYTTIDTFDSLLEGILFRVRVVLKKYPHRFSDVIRAIIRTRKGKK